jgi:uncharacterized protein (DUF111 family)
VLTRVEDADRMAGIIFKETTTFYGPINVKVAQLPDGGVRATPEYEDCRKATEAHGVSLRVVTQEAEHVTDHRFGIPH